MKKLKLAIYLLTLVFALTGCKKDVHVKTISEIKQGIGRIKKFSR